FTKVMEAIQIIPKYDLDFKLEVLKTIHRVFIAHEPARNIFRKVGGYVNLIYMIVALEGAFEDPQQFFASAGDIPREADDNNLQWLLEDRIISLLEGIFFILSESMREHEINKKVFLQDVGYGTVENALILTGAFKREGIPRKIFNVLFAFGLDDNWKCNNGKSGENTDVEGTYTASNRLESIRSNIESSLSVNLVNPEVLPTILHLQKLVSTSDPQLSESILRIICALAQSSRGNQVKINSCGLTLDLLKRIFPEQQATELFPVIESQERAILLRITKRVMAMGVNLKDLRYIFQRFNVNDGDKALESSPGLLDLLLHTASRSRWPNFLQFDNDTSTHSSLEIPRLSGFPPQSQGYTLLAWIHLDRQDGGSNLLLFSLWDSNAHLAFRIYIDSQTKTIKVFNPTAHHEANFTSFQFQTGYWYHVAIVHHKSRLSLKSSTMNLYINGSFVLGKETINLMFNLGARYKSLFQDSLHQYQTNEATTALITSFRTTAKSHRLRKELAHSPHAFLISLKDGHFLQQQVSENKILLAIFASNFLSEGAQAGLISTKFNMITEVTIKDEIDNGSRILLNSAIAKVGVAMRHLEYMVHLKGNPLVAYPLGLDESIWNIGGCGIALKLVELSKTKEMLCKSTSILFELIRYSWRNSKDIERCHGYEIYAYLLKCKRDLISTELLDLILVFIGKNTQELENSTINNPLAYRYIVLNFNIWKKTPLVVQKTHLDQFILFFETSKARHYNSKRLPKIHLVKKFLLALRMNVYAKELYSSLTKSFKAILLINWTTESIRAAAAFLASTIRNSEYSYLVSYHLRC
ncbi:hypothetical protein BDF20DRAFT_828883, partial [Mycotypha africana]|uniref:uncharacterized protein n=1 Tax=Mycotypha africana TaxID=64632 RepID=UPI0023006A86